MGKKYFSILVVVLSIFFIFTSGVQADQDLTDKIKILPAGIAFDPKTGKTSINFKLWNISTTTLSGPFKVVIDKMDNNYVSLKNPDGYDSSGKPYYLYNQGKLSPKGMTANKKWIFEHKCKKITIVEFKEHKLLEIIFQGKCSNLVTVYISILGTGGNANHAPVANAGPDQTAYVGDTVKLDGSKSSDVDGNPLTFRWTLTSRPNGSAATLLNATAVNPTFAADRSGTYVAQLIVNDGKIDSAPDTVAITVNLRMVIVPNLLGSTQDEAKKMITGVRLTVGTITTANSATIPAGQVMSQYPLAGASIPEGSPVNFVVSLGPVMVTVPNVVSMTQTAAQSTIVATHLTVGSITTANHASIPTGSVISQSPVAGGSVPESTSVSLVVSLGPLLVNVPNVVSMTQASAEAAITGVGLKVGAISTKSSDTVVSGNVLSQNPSSGTSVLQGSSVNLVISLGLVEVMLSPTASVVDDLTMANLSSISEDGRNFFFSASTPQIDSLKTGDVILSGVTAVTPGGILRKVFSVEKRGDGTVEVITEPASLTDAFQELHIKGSIPSAGSAPVPYKQAPLAAPMAVTTATLPPITYSIPSTDFALSGNYQSTLFGNYTFNPDLDYEIDISWFTLENFKLVLKGAQTLTLNEQLQIEASGSWSREVSLVKQPLFIAAVPTTIPFVVFTLEFIPSIGFETSVGGQLDLGFGFTASNNLTAGVQYSNGTWSSITSYDYSFNHYYSLAGDTTFSIRPYFRGRIGFYLDDVLGPYIDLQPYGKWSFITYPEVYEEFGVGMEGNAGGEVKVLTKALEDISLQLFDLYYPIFPHSTPTLISGKVTNAESLGLAGATLSLNGTVDLSDTNGNYSFKVDQNETYIITPMLVGYTFDPPTRTVTVFDTNVAGQDFIAHINAPSPVLSSVTIAPATAALTIGNTQQFTAQAFDQFNNPMVPQLAFTWASSNTTIGTVNSAGLFSALSAGGPINITASIGSVSGSALVTVSVPAPALTSISVTPATAKVTLGHTQQFTATAVDQYGNAIISQPSFTWASSNASIGTVDTTGLFTGVSIGGPITISASAGAVSGSGSVTVSPVVPPPPVGEGLVAYYQFENNANDVSGNENHGTPSGGVAFVEGVFGKAVKFSGYANPGFIHIPNSQSLQFDKTMSIAFWARIDDIAGEIGSGTGSPNGTHCFFAKDQDQMGFFSLGDFSGWLFGAGGPVPNDRVGKLYAGFGNGTFLNWNVEIVNEVPGYNIGQWIHIAYVITTNEVQMFLNGVLARSKAASTDFTIANGRDLYIGMFWDFWYPLNGAIDEFRVYNRALTASEIQAMSEIYSGAASWPMFGHDARHTGQSPYFAPKTPTLRWTFEFKESWGGNPVTGGGGSPVIDSDGTVYVTATYVGPMGFLYAVNTDGTLKWKVGPDVIATSPAIGLDGTIYVARDEWLSWNNLWAFDKSGNNIWSYPIAAQSKGPVISPKGVLYICDETALYAINSDGSLKWKNDLAYGCLTPALTHDGSIIVINAAHGNYSTLISFDKETGQTNWSLDTDAPAGGIFPVINSDGTIYVLGANPYFKNIYSISPSGLVNWKKEVTDSPLCHLIAQDGTIYLGSSDLQGAGALYALFPTGDVKWIYRTGVVFGSPAIGADGTIYFGTSRYPESNLGDSKIVALRPDGSLLWEYFLPPVQGEETFYSVIGTDGTLYVSCNGSLYAFRD